MPFTSHQDILEHIIAHPILRNQRETLATCSLVCSSWVWNSRCHLFRDVLLARTDKAQSFTELFISPNCTIGPHIRNVKIKIHGRSKVDTAVVSGAIQAVAKYALACHHLSISPFIWKDFPISTRNAFLRLVNIKDLKLFEAQCQSLKELLVVVGFFPALMSLELNNATFNRHIVPSTMPLPLSLTDLSLSGSGFTPLHSCIVKTVLPKLSRVKISLPPSSFPDISGWMKQHASTLEHVEICAEDLPVWNVGSMLTNAWSLLDFSEFGRLKTLSFDFDPYEAGIDHFRVVAAILRQITSPSLSRLSVFCTANLAVHHRAALPIMQNWVNTFNEPRFIAMGQPQKHYAQITRQEVIISHAQIYCNNVDDFDGRWTNWLMNNLRDPHHVLDIINC